MNRDPNAESMKRSVVLGTSAPNRFRTTSSVLSFFHDNNILRRFEIEQCSIHENGEILIRFGTAFAAQLFALRLQSSESTSRFFQIIKMCGSELQISQYVVLNLCVQRRSRDGNKFNNVIRRWRGEGIIDCNADRRQFYLYLFKDGSDAYIKLSIDDRILEKICLLNNDYSAGIQFQVSEPPRCEVHREPELLSCDEQKRNGVDVCPTVSSNEPLCPKILLTGSCTNTSCTFRHNIDSGDADEETLGNNEQFWLKESKLPPEGDSGDADEEKSDDDDEERGHAQQQQQRQAHRGRGRYRGRGNYRGRGRGGFYQPQSNNHYHDRRKGEEGWSPAANHIVRQPTVRQYLLDKTSDELEQEHCQYVPWTFEVGSSEVDSLHSLLKFLGQCWLFCVEFVRMKTVPERFVNAIRQMRGINPNDISQLTTDYEARYPIPPVFAGKLSQSADPSKEKLYYHPPFEYMASSRSSVLRLKRHLHDLNFHGAHDVAFAMEACLHNFPPVFIPEDLVDTNQCNVGGGANALNAASRDPDIFFKCLFQEIKSQPLEDENFSNLMNQKGQQQLSAQHGVHPQHRHHQGYHGRRGHGQNQQQRSKQRQNLNVVWQALLHCAKNDDYRVDRSTVCDDHDELQREAQQAQQQGMYPMHHPHAGGRGDVQAQAVVKTSKKQKEKVLPALELFYRSLDWAGSNGRHLKQKLNGTTHADHVWIKRVSVTPLTLSCDICEEESTRMFRLAQYAPPTDFCRIEFMDVHSNRSMPKEHFKVGAAGRSRAYQMLAQGLCVSGVVYNFLFFGNKQVRDAKAWMKAELTRGFDANRVRADIARLSSERNIGKKMDRFHLFMSKGTPGSIYAEEDIEIIDDLCAADGKLLTDGCSLILASEMKRSFPEFVASMLVRIGGAKTQMMSASRELLEKLVLRDIEATSASAIEAQKAMSARNLSPKVILTKSSLKFMTDTQKQLEIKKCCRALPCMMNREFVNNCMFHRICQLQPDTLEYYNEIRAAIIGGQGIPDKLKNYKLKGIHKQALFQLFSKYQRSFCSQLDKMEDICCRQLERLKEIKERYGARAVYYRPASQEEQKFFFDTLLFLSSRLKVEEPFLKRLTEQVSASSNGSNADNNKSVDAGKRLNFKDLSDLSAILKRLWGGLKSKFKIQLPWPSCRIAGIADFQFLLGECEVFLKVKIPTYFDWNCTQCGKTNIKYWNDTCDNAQCGAAHPMYYVHRGPVGLMKNPCLHPGSYRLFEGVYLRELDEMFDGEVLVFSASSKLCTTSQVHKLSGGDLDGDDFLCVVQRDLLPLQNDVIACMEYDADEPRKMAGYVDIAMCVEYWLNYQINDCVGIIAELHEAFSDSELAVGSPQCLALANAHSAAVDYAKTGVAAKVPKGVGIPLPISRVKYPHHMGKHQAISYKSTSVKGRLYDAVRIPAKLWRDREFRKQYNLKNNHVAYHFSGQADGGAGAGYLAEKPMVAPLSNREKLKERLNRGCSICGIASFGNAHLMNQHKDDPVHKRNKQMARDKAMLQRIKDAKVTAQYKTNIGQSDFDHAPHQPHQPQQQRQQPAMHHHQQSRHHHQQQMQQAQQQRQQIQQQQMQQQQQQQLQLQQRQLQQQKLQQQQQQRERERERERERAQQQMQLQQQQLQQQRQNAQQQQQQQQRPSMQVAQGRFGHKVKMKAMSSKQHSTQPRRGPLRSSSHPQPQPHPQRSHSQRQPSPESKPKMASRMYPYSTRESQIKEAKDAAITLGFERAAVEKEMKLFLETVQVSGHSLNPTCFLNYLCEISSSET